MEDKDFVFLKTMYVALDKVVNEDLPMGLLYYCEKAKEEVSFLTFKSKSMLFEEIEDLSSYPVNTLSKYELVQYVLQFFELTIGNLQLFHPLEVTRLKYYISLMDIEYRKGLTKK